MKHILDPPLKIIIELKSRKIEMPICCSLLKVKVYVTSDDCENEKRIFHAALNC